MAFCDRYFQSVGAALTYEDEQYREYELPRDVDKELTDRPYYWLWVEQTQQTVPPTVLRLAFAPEAVDRENARLRADALEAMERQSPSDIERMFFRPPTAEFITLGSFRLEKVYASVAMRGRFACVKPIRLPGGAKHVPWLLLNAVLSQRCDLVEQQFVSLGLCLSNGQIIERFVDALGPIEMVDCAPATLLPLCKISVTAGVENLRRHLERMIAAKPHVWAREASLRLDRELHQIGTYYDSILPDVPPGEHVVVAAERQRKERALVLRTQPRVDIDIQQLALVALGER